ncbi:hypothetical protein NCS57_00283700 [Fusarium keratoplasticum]|uniref:Uncharacterized protein n=1 Tax=Fusarium keratoplasticum TaxID=1328300 RepID=A0ACC0RB99_9HYPO|nr:hypothetical protein NCS57_00283700 [Fusarium keratoplasticum]KAI8680040.1 hypothetical protein NCS57_00283700 [Fusarium keratoplasticum]
MEPVKIQEQHNPVPADSLKRNETTAREAMRLEDGHLNPFAVSKPHCQAYFEGLAQRRHHRCRRNWLLLVACTQPRVIAVTSVARRVAQELDVGLGDEFGYAVRFDNTSNDRTILKFLMDGLLLQELRSDRELSRYACVMVDEAHERTKNTDLLLALLKQAMGMRPDLKVVVISATIDFTTFSRYFPGSNVFHAEGHAYPVQIQYLREATPDYRKAVLETVAHITQTKPEGSILVFMTSVQEIEETCGLIRKKVPGLQVLPLYSSLSRAQMEDVMDTNTGRKCILSINTAENSLAIDGITFAIVMEEVLVLKSCGFHKISNLNFVDGPHAETLLRALYELRALEYIDADAKLTTKGFMVVGMPVDTAWYNAFLKVKELGCLAEIVTAACLLSTQDDITMRPNAPRYVADVIRQQYPDAKSDHLARLNAFHSYIHRHIESASDEDKLARWCRMSFINPKVAEQALKMRNGLMPSVSKRMLDNEPVLALEPSDPDFGLKIRQSLAADFYHKVVYLERRGTYKTVHENQPVLPKPDSCLVGEKYEWVICDHISFAGMRYVTAIDPVWIMDLEHFQEKNLAYNFDGETLKYPYVKASLDLARATRASRSL